MKKTALMAITAIPLLFSYIGFVSAKTTKSVEFLNSRPASATLPFSDIVRVENTLYLSGQIGINPATDKLVKGGIKAEAKQTLTNIKQTLNKHGYAMNQVVKCTVMLTDIADFKSFNEVYTSFFSPPYPARSAFAVNKLVLNSVLEVECIASINK